MKSRLLRLLAALLVLAGAGFSNTAIGASNPPLLSGNASGDDEFLPPDEAFRFSGEVTGPNTLHLRWAIADGYYLYKAKIKAASDSQIVQLGAPDLPQGDEKTDEYFGTQQVYHQFLEADVPFSRASPEGGTFDAKVTYQGCADAGLCYPPITKTLQLSLAPVDASSLGSKGASGGGLISEQDRLARLIQSGNILLVLATFFGFGLLLSLTPCVLPMVPILSGIIAGHGNNVTTRKAFALSLAYVLGMAVTYTVAGAAFAAAGQQAQAFFQQTWIIVLFALLFVVLALAMFGVYELQVPAAIQTRLASLSNQQKAGSYAGTAVMGALSALIVTTCVAPPLVATLAVIGQAGDVVRGALALFALSIGMGTPLLIVGASAGKAPAESRRLDGNRQAFLRNPFSRGRDLDGPAHPAGAGRPGTLGRPPSHRSFRARRVPERSRCIGRALAGPRCQRSRRRVGCADAGRSGCWQFRPISAPQGRGHGALNRSERFVWPRIQAGAFRG